MLDNREFWLLRHGGISKPSFVTVLARIEGGEAKGTAMGTAVPLLRPPLSGISSEWRAPRVRGLCLPHSLSGDSTREKFAGLPESPMFSVSPNSRHA